jgi:hypothetical protein
MSEKLGIDKIKEVLGTFVDVGVLGYEMYADDKKISVGEGVKLAFKVPAIWGAVKDIKPAIEEAKDLDPAELEELMIFVLDKLEQIKALQE